MLLPPKTGTVFLTVSAFLFAMCCYAIGVWSIMDALLSAPMTRSGLTAGQLVAAVRRREGRGVWGCAQKKAR